MDSPNEEHKGSPKNDWTSIVFNKNVVHSMQAWTYETKQFCTAFGSRCHLRLGMEIK